MSATYRKSTQADIDRATAWNLAHPERRREINLKSYLKYRPPLKPVETAHQRFDRLHIPVTESGCWLWLGACDKDGYGKVKVDGRDRRSHHWAWELFRGELPRGVWVLHKCDVPGCVNPDHLFLGDLQTNVDDCVKKDRHAKGTRNGCAILTEDDVRTVRRLKGKWTQQELAQLVGVSRGHISRVLSDKLWKEVR